MKKQTQIISLDLGANFLAEDNKDGKILDVSGNAIVRFVPFEDIQNILRAVNGKFVDTTNRLQLFVPLNFENNNVDNSVLNVFPAELNFFIQVVDSGKFAHCGLNFKVSENNLLVLTPKAGSKEYILQNNTIQAKPCGKGNVISADDMVVQIPADISADSLIKLAGAGISNISHLKIEVGGKQVVISLSGDLSELHRLLNSFISKKTSVKIRNNADDSLLKEFTEVFVTRSVLPSDIIGIVSIPKTAIKSNETEFAKYTGLNHFITHFPNVKTKLEIEISVNSFDSSDKLFLDNKPVSFIVSNHPEQVDRKKVSCSVDNYFIYVNKQKTILMKIGTKTFELPVNPMLTFDFTTGKSKINISKNIN